MARLWVCDRGVAHKTRGSCFRIDIFFLSPFFCSLSFLAKEAVALSVLSFTLVFALAHSRKGCASEHLTLVSFIQRSSPQSDPILSSLHLLFSSEFFYQPEPTTPGSPRCYRLDFWLSVPCTYSMPPVWSLRCLATSSEAGANPVRCVRWVPFIGQPCLLIRLLIGDRVSAQSPSFTRSPTISRLHPRPPPLPLL